MYIESRGAPKGGNDGSDSGGSQSLSLSLSLLNEKELMQDDEFRMKMIKPFVLSTEAADVY